MNLRRAPATQLLATHARLAGRKIGMLSQPAAAAAATRGPLSWRIGRRGRRAGRLGPVMLLLGLRPTRDRRVGGPRLRLRSAPAVVAVLAICVRPPVEIPDYRPALSWLSNF